MRMLKQSTAFCITACFLLNAPQSEAQVGAKEAACRVAIAKATSKYVKTTLRVIVACHKQRDKGRLAADCNDLAIVDSKGKAEKASQKLRDNLGGKTDKCSVNGDMPLVNVLAQFGRCPSPAQSTDDGGSTSGIDDFGELAECLISHVDQIVQGTARNVLGLPTLPLNDQERVCHLAVSKGYAKLVNTILKERTRCQADQDKAGGSIGFTCLYADPRGRIQAVRDGLRESLAGACLPSARSVLGRRTQEVDSRAAELCTAGSLDRPECVVTEQSQAAGTGMAAMMWTLPGICPGSGSYRVVTIPTNTAFDTGFSGLFHDMDPILGYRGAQFTITCDADCANCVSTAVDPPIGACRCANDASVCSAPGPTTCNGNPCECFYGPPVPVAAAGYSLCITNRIVGAMTGSLDVNTGEMELSVPLQTRIQLGETIDMPCPTCVAGLCRGGDFEGGVCSVDATDPTLGDVSFNCPPDPLKNVSGTGNHVFDSNVDFTTGYASMAFGADCTPPNESLRCACAVCSGDNLLACNADSDCAAVGAGTCSEGAATSGTPVLPNECSDLTCSPGTESGEGTCLAGPVDTFCDGFVRSNGDGILPCSDDADCVAYGASCPGGDCGVCSLGKNRECFLDPIEAQGEPGESIVGIGCIRGTFNSAINHVVGWPGAYRVKQNLATEILCSDGVVPFIPPGGSNCPTTTVGPTTTTTLGGTTTTMTVTSSTCVGEAPTTTTTLANACGDTFPSCGGECPLGTSCSNGGAVCECQSTGACAPATILRRFKSRLGDCQNSVRETQLSAGWSGSAHGIDIPGDLGEADAVDVTCDTNCENCNIDLNPIKDRPEAYCRCENNPRQVCDTVNGPDEDDCGTGYNDCRCNFGPPLAISAGGTPVCVINRIKSDHGGTMNLHTGEWFDTAALVSMVHLGNTVKKPCPTCDGDASPNDGVRDGTCSSSGGASCDVNGAHPSFGPVSFDCPPDPLNNVSGSGVEINLKLTTDEKSLPAQLPCDPPFDECFCRVCSGDEKLGCTSDADCEISAAGSCTAGGGGASVRPNACNDGVCSAQGRCDAGPVDKFCDGRTYPDGRGFITCSDDAECRANGNGNCSIEENRRCFTDPIVRQGDTDPSNPVSVAIFCIPATYNAATNAALGLPGPGTLDLEFMSDIRCRNDINTPYQLPDGSNCP